MYLGNPYPGSAFSVDGFAFDDMEICFLVRAFGQMGRFGVDSLLPIINFSLWISVFGVLSFKLLLET